MKSSTETLIGAMRILARDIQSDDGVANSAISEAADRLEELSAAKRYAVFCMLPNNEPHGDPCLEPLSYGRDDDLEPQLLLRRKRVSLFDTREAAEVALTAVLVDCAGMEFVRRLRFIILECE